MLASVAAWRESDEWLDELIRVLDANRWLLAELLEARLPAVGYAPPQAGYLAWLDCRELELGDDPAATFLERGRVGAQPGPAVREPAALGTRGSTSPPPRSSSRRSSSGWRRRCG